MKTLFQAFINLSRTFKTNQETRSRLSALAGVVFFVVVVATVKFVAA